MRLHRTMRVMQMMALALALMVAGTGCKKKIAAAAPPAPITPTAKVPDAMVAKPVISFNGDPLTVVRGDAVTLRWAVQNSDAVTIEPGVGTLTWLGIPTGVENCRKRLRRPSLSREIVG